MVNCHFFLVPATNIAGSRKVCLILPPDKTDTTMKKIRIAALGDSLTKGVILNDENRYSVLDDNFIDIISRELDLNIENFGKFGCTVGFGEKMLERHADMIASADYTFLEYGGNDCDFHWKEIADSPMTEHQPKTILDAFRRQFLALVEKVRKLGSRPVIISLPPIDSESYFSFLSRYMNQQQKDNIVRWLGGDIGIISRWHEKYNQVLFDIARSTQTRILDITTPFENHNGGVTDLLCSDGIHPNAAGHKLIAASISNIYL